MARLTSLFAVLFAAASLNPLAVEYDLDRPLESVSAWRYYQSSHFYAQHRCSDGQLQAVARRIQLYLSAPQKETEAELGPVLQVRLYASAVDYRKNLRFSKYRDGHYNRRLNMIVTYCDVAAQRLAEQLTLHSLADRPLRKWQRIFLAEAMSVIARGSLQSAFSDVADDKPAALMHVLYSNHWPGRSERATLKLLTRYLAERQKLEAFVQLLLEPTGTDDTGFEALESLIADDLPGLHQAIENPDKTNGNKTLRKGQTK